jgi:hypothetical protein
VVAGDAPVEFNHCAALRRVIAPRQETVRTYLAAVLDAALVVR